MSLNGYVNICKMLSSNRGGTNHSVGFTVLLLDSSPFMRLLVLNVVLYFLTLFSYTTFGMASFFFVRRPPETAHILHFFNYL